MYLDIPADHFVKIYQTSHNNRFQEQVSRKWTLLYTPLSQLKQVMQYFAIFPPLGGASSILKWNGIYIAPNSIVREITNDPQVASGTTREEPYFYCHLLHRFIFSSIEFPGLDSPGKGGVEEMPVPK